MVPITVVIPTLDEAARIEACVASVPWTGEVIVADGGSTDASKWGAQDRFDRGRRASVSDMLVRPAWRLVKTLIAAAPGRMGSEPHRG